MELLIIWGLAALSMAIQMWLGDRPGSETDQLAKAIASAIRESREEQHNS